MAAEILVTGAGGQLGGVLVRRLVGEGRSVFGLISPGGPRPHVGDVVPCDITHADAVTALIRERQPACIIHAAALTRVSECFDDPDRAQRINVEATRHLVELAEEIGARFLVTSTDLVFDGADGDYDESSPVRPTSIYGRTKVAAERIVLSYRRGVAVRLALMYGLPASLRQTTFLEQLAALRDRRPLKLFHDEFRSALELDDAAAAIDRVASSDFTGIVHAAGPEALSRLEMGQIAAAALGVDGGNIVAISQTDVPTTEPRPADVSMVCERFRALLGSPPGRSMAETMPGIAREFLARQVA